MTNTKQTEQTKKNKTINTIVNVILVLAILFAIFCAFTAFVSRDATNAPNFLGVYVFNIQSDSMNPTFKAGDLIVGVKVRKAEKLKVGTVADKEGDVITFLTTINGKLAYNSHRIVGREWVRTDGLPYTADGEGEGYYQFTTRGDNAETNKYNDEFHPRGDKVVSKYLFRLPGLGTFINFLQTSTGFFLVIFLPVALFFIWQIVVFFRSLFAYQNEKTRLEVMAQMNAAAETPAPAQEGDAPADKSDGDQPTDEQ